MNAHYRSASHENARDSRRTRVSSCGAERDRRRSWLCRFRRTRKAVDHSLRLIEESCRVVEAAERFAARRPLRAARQYRRVSDVLDEVTVQLAAAAQTLQMGARQIGAGELGPEALARATAHWSAATQKLFVLSSRLGDTFDLIMEAIGSGTTLDLSTLATYPSGATPRVIRLRPRPARRLPLGSSCNRVLRQRRRRAGRRKFAEAARRIFRGRAPPFVSTCLL
jgi:hypothetical protein